MKRWLAEGEYTIVQGGKEFEDTSDVLCRLNELRDETDDKSNFGFDDSDSDDDIDDDSESEFTFNSSRMEGKGREGKLGSREGGISPEGIGGVAAPKEIYRKKKKLIRRTPKNKTFTLCCLLVLLCPLLCLSLAPHQVIIYLSFISLSFIFFCSSLLLFFSSIRLTVMAAF
tara:strand:- start:868 stop:1380 length:513 start_codon:yes stop_codon:yes gene_type:complete